MAARAAAGQALHKCKVLFCTRHFPYGFQFTKEALQDDNAIELVQCNADEVAQHIGDAHIAVPFMAKLDDVALAAGRELKMVIQYGVGVETTDMAAATKRGIWVSNIPSVGMGNALSCAEHVIYLTLALLRNQPAMAASVARRRIGSPLGHTLAGKRVLLFGLGNIGVELLPRLKAFDAHVTVVRARERPPTADTAANGNGCKASDGTQQNGAQRGDVLRNGAHQNGGAHQDSEQPHLGFQEAGVGRVALLAALPAADIVVLTCTLNNATRSMVDSAFLDACRPGVRIVNVARGGLLEYDAVLQGLESGKIGGLGVDVAWEEPLDPADPLWRHPTVIATPHIAGVTELSYRNMAQKLAAEVRLVQQGLQPSVILNPAVLSA